MNLVDYSFRCSIYGQISSQPNLFYRVNQLSSIRQFTVQDENYEAVPTLFQLAVNGDNFGVVTELGAFLLFKPNLDNVAKWQVHQNAIFDFKWRPQHNYQILTVSGDQSICLFDTERGCRLRTISDAHLSSIKSISCKDKDVFVTGARDGFIKLWDLRLDNPLLLSIESAHIRSQKAKRRTASVRRVRSCPTNSVTCVHFQGDRFYSAGPNDGRIKVWDTVVNKNKKPIREILYPDPSRESQHGYSSFTFNSSGDLFANCTDHHVYCYSSNEFELKYRYTGHKVNNYTKLTVFKDRFLVSGSTDRQAYLWSLKSGKKQKDDVRWPVVSLPHMTEVAAVETKNWNIFTCEEQTIKRWDFDNLFSDRIVDKAVVYDDREVRRTYEKKRPLSIANSSFGSSFRSLTSTPTVSKRIKISKSAPLTPITNFLNITPRVKCTNSSNDEPSNKRCISK